MWNKLFKRENPEEQAKIWRRQLNSEGRKIEMQVRKIEREELKVKQAAKQAARKGDTAAVRILSKEIIRSRRAVRRLYTARAQMNSVSMQLQQQVSQIKLAGSMKKSTEIMANVNELMRIGEVQGIMQVMGKEMMKAGLIEEMMNDTIDNTLDDDISDTELDEEVNKVVEEVMHGQMQGAAVGHAKIPQAQKTEELEAVDDDDDELLEKFNALRGSS